MTSDATMFTSLSVARDRRARSRAKRGANQSQLPRIGGGGRRWEVERVSARARDDARETRARRTDAAEMF